MQLMREVFTFLQDCHKMGIFYGDVKPANFMLQKGENNGLKVKAVDFGCSQQVSQTLLSNIVDIEYCNSVRLTAVDPPGISLVCANHLQGVFPVLKGLIVSCSL